MNTSNTSRQRPDPEVSIKGLDQTFSALDANRATGYASLGQVRAAKSASLAREQKFLNIKYGTAASPRARYAAAALTKNEQLRREVAAAAETLEVNAPVVDENSFVLYGFVRRKNQAGVPGLTLALTDEQGTWLRRYGYACTDARGYFELRIERQPKDGSTEPSGPSKTAEEIKKEAELARLEKEREAAAAAAGAKPAEGTSSGGIKTNVQALGSGQRINTNQDAAAKRSPIQLRVFNREGRVLHIESRPVTPKADTVDYRLIILGDDGDCGCTPPPEKSDGEGKHTSPRAPVAPPPAPAQPAPAATAEPRVAKLKTYDNPAPVDPSQPLEAIRGIGPKTATKLRDAGVADVAEYKKTAGAKFVQVSGFDKTTQKPAATAKPATRAPAAPAKEKSPAAARPAQISDKKSQMTSAPARAAAKAPAKKPAAKPKRPAK